MSLRIDLGSASNGMTDARRLPPVSMPGPPDSRRAVTPGADLTLLDDAERAQAESFGVAGIDGWLFATREAELLRSRASVSLVRSREVHHVPVCRSPGG